MSLQEDKIAFQSHLNHYESKVTALLQARDNLANLITETIKHRDYWLEKVAQAGRELKEKK